MHRRSFRWLVALSSCALLLFAGERGRPQAAGYSPPFWTVDGGGAGGAAGGEYRLSATAGQPDAGALAGNVRSLLGGFWGAFLSAAPRWSGPTLCTASTTDVVGVRSAGALSRIGADVVVAVNAEVVLAGVAESESIDADCTVHRDPLPAVWTLRFEAAGGAVVDLTGALAAAATLAPRFTATDPGVYRVELRAGSQTATLRILAITDAAHGTWVSIGPTNVAGHIEALAIDPVTKAIYAGAYSGGVWKSGDGGATWAPLTDVKLPTLNIRSLAVVRAGGEAKVYAGTDDAGIFQSADGGSTWRRSGEDASCDNEQLRTQSVRRIVAQPDDAARLYAATSAGVFQSVDSGGCWESVLSAGSASNIRDLVISPTTPATLYAAAYRGGIFRASAADPKSWTSLNQRAGSGLPAGPPFNGKGRFKLTAGDKRLFVGQPDLDAGVPEAETQVAAADLDARGTPALSSFQGQEMHSDPTGNRVFDAGDAVYRHSGEDVPDCPFFSKGVALGDLRLSGGGAGRTVGAGDPDLGTCLFPFHNREMHSERLEVGQYDPEESIYRDSSFNMVVLAASVSEPGTLYAGFEPGPYQIFKSTNGGDSWEELAPPPQRCDNDQCNGYDNFLQVDPRDAAKLYLGQVAFFASHDGGGSWVELTDKNTNPAYLDQAIHVDQHALAFDPDDSKVFLVANDGGIYRFTLAGDLLPSWTPLNQGLVTTEFYDLGLSAQEEHDAAGGLQDNGSLLRRPGGEWEDFCCGDGYRTAFDGGSTAGRRVVYFDQYWGRASEGLQRFREEGWEFERIGEGQFYADPFRPGSVLRLDAGQLFRADNADTATAGDPAQWNCIDPTPADGGDGVTALAFLPPALPPATTSFYLVGTGRGAIYRVAAAADLPRTATCGATLTPGVSATPLFPALAPAVGCVTPGASVRGVAADPGHPDSLYATFSKAGAGRILRLVSQGDGTYCGVDISGDANPAGEGRLPGELRLGDVQPVPSAAGTEPGVHVATDRGIYLGRLHDGLWTWSLAFGSPRVGTPALRARVDRSGAAQTVRAGTYGRGVFELVGFGKRAPLRAPGARSLVAAAGDAIESCEAQELGDPASRDRVLRVLVRYAYASSHGPEALLRAIALQGSEAPPFFVTGAVPVRKGAGSASLLLFYAGAGAPLSLRTDALRIELADGGRHPFTTAVCPLAKSWKRADARTLSVSALARGGEGSSVPVAVPLAIAAPGARSPLRPPFAIVLPLGTSVVLTAPRRARVGGEDFAFTGWSGVGEIGRATDRLSISLTRDLAPVANYRRQTQVAEARLKVLAICRGCAGAPQEIEAPITVRRGPQALALTTPDLSVQVQGVALRLEAPRQVVGEQGALEFVSWKVAGRAVKQRRIALRLTGDRTVTARYRPVAGAQAAEPPEDEEESEDLAPGGVGGVGVDGGMSP